jgi:beta-lactamase superfamily II metal-dependent hydrolase
MKTEYVSKDSVPLFKAASGSERLLNLLWGDRVTYDETQAVSGGRVKGRARGFEGFVNKADLGGESLLEIYFIDVGQGDGVLIRTPDDKHIMIDGGYKRSAQPTGKNAADFVDWKFVKDYRRNDIVLDAMIASHNDADHYGGLWDLINPNETRELDAQSVTVKKFYTAGVSWFKKAGKRCLGDVTTFNGTKYLTSLVSSRQDVQGFLAPGAPMPLQGEWREFLECIHALNCPVKRLSQKSKWLDGFGANDGPVRVKVLGPVEFAVNNKPALKSLASADSQNTNGHSVLLRVDYDRVRVLLTGDLNAKSQAVLLDEYTGARQEFACDVVKACHHGADDCSFEFLRTISAAATVISSGDEEGHGHPRPSIVAASALTGFQNIDKDRVVTPLIYQTEVARSYRLGKPTKITGPNQLSLDKMSDLTAEYLETTSGALKPRKGSRKLNFTYLVTGVLYGLVNVRTDGDKILCATLNEADKTWDIKTFRSRF